MNKKKLQIRNSTAEFLIFSAQASENTIEVMVQDGTVWLTQKMLSALFEVEVNTINYHLKEIFKSDELQDAATIRKFRIVQTEGSREVSREVEFYNLDAIISIGYRVNSQRATQFRQWATAVLRDFAIAKAFAESEFEKYRVVQDRLFESDFGKMLKKTLGADTEKPNSP